MLIFCKRQEYLKHKIEIVLINYCIIFRGANRRQNFEQWFPIYSVLPPFSAEFPWLHLIFPDFFWLSLTSPISPDIPNFPNFPWLLSYITERKKSEFKKDSLVSFLFIPIFLLLNVLNTNKQIEFINTALRQALDEY